ncbi:hypothetical protein NLG97_g224 [Lecanicillium saksenae]|uniref:Uncharacterized protein n=1 Tax=Lecanicillium saksenae TaxID=468837 RepID=A0ACC1R8N1_9HYPO|nr:hypothetical protein NLG97_g224 [Lecanicillium saksenae]
MARIRKDPLEHISIGRRCGACCALFQIKERIVAVVTKTGSAPEKSLGPFPYGQSEIKDDGGNPHRACYRNSDAGVHCRSPHWNLPETATLHRDCQILFMRRFHLPNRLKTLADLSTWQYPWREARFIERIGIDRVWRATTGEEHILGMPRLLSLPVEIKDQIWGYARPCCVERYGAVLDLVEDLSNASQGSQGPATAPLCHVYSWRRGSQPILQQDISESVIRMTVDARGLLRIERLREMPRQASFHAKGLFYIVEGADRLSGATAQFKLGFCRLVFTRGPPADLYQWDTPNPPARGDFSFYPTQCSTPRGTETAYARFPGAPSVLETADIPKQCTGMTLLMDGLNLQGFHLHTPKEPSAAATFRRLMPDETQVWIFVPFQHGIKTLGFRKSYHSHDEISHEYILLHLHAEGQLKIGGSCFNETYQEAYTDIFMGSSPSMLIYQEYLCGEKVYQQLLACLSAEPLDNSTWPFPGSDPDAVSTDHLMNPLYQSSACLDHVARTEIFLDTDKISCRGILVQYEDGTERALGECRVGVDPSQTCVKPQEIWYKDVSWDSIGTELFCKAEVEFRSSTTNVTLREGWLRAEMERELKCWFNHEVAFFKIT